MRVYWLSLEVSLWEKEKLGLRGCDTCKNSPPTSRTCWTPSLGLVLPRPRSRTQTRLVQPLDVPQGPTLLGCKIRSASLGAPCAYSPLVQSPISPVHFPLHIPLTPSQGPGLAQVSSSGLLPQPLPGLPDSSRSPWGYPGIFLHSKLTIPRAACPQGSCSSQRRKVQSPCLIRNSCHNLVSLLPSHSPLHFPSMFCAFPPHILVPVLSAASKASLSSHHLTSPSSPK